MDQFAVVAGEDDIRPRLDTVQVFEQEGGRFRLYVTVGGAIAVDRWDEKRSAWNHVPLKAASHADMADVLAARYNTEDEEIARSLASYSG